MKVADPGHLYELATLDGNDALDTPAEVLRFVKRVGDNYPGNVAPPYPGATSQEVIRALIDRTKYVDNQRKHGENQRVLRHLRMALYSLEKRAATERGEWQSFYDAAFSSPSGLIEDSEVCAKCGHIGCARHKDQP